MWHGGQPSHDVSLRRLAADAPVKYVVLRTYYYLLLALAF
jgi:hypothetical protein